MKNVYIMRGIPGSGKSTYIKDKLDGIAVVSRDDIRQKYFGVGDDEKAILTPSLEHKVTEIFWDQIEALISRKNDIVIDNTNLKNKYLNKMFDYFNERGYLIYIIQMTTDIQTCISRRKDQIPLKVMLQMYNDMINNHVDEEKVHKIINI